jgi:hypothetical protein
VATSSETIADDIARLPPDSAGSGAHLPDRPDGGSDHRTEDQLRHADRHVGRPNADLHRGMKQHVSLHAAPPVEPLEDELRPYRSGKGTVRVPLDEPVPYQLIDALIHPSPKVARHDAALGEQPSRLGP